MNTHGIIPVSEDIDRQVYEQILSFIRLRVTETYAYPPEIVQVDGITIATLGNFSASVGKPKSKKLTFDKLVINLDSYELIVDGKKIDTPPKEMELLYHLASSPNRVFTRNQLLDEVWGFDYFGDSRTVDVHVKRLREKLEGVSDKWTLKTVWGVGYKFEAEET